MKKLTAILGCSTLTCALFAAPTPTVIPAMNAPKLDGVIEAAEWSAALQQKLVPFTADAKISQPTLTYVGCDSKNLYLAFRCQEAQIDKMRRIHTHMEERDSTIYQDDCVEIFIDLSGNNPPGMFHFAVNSCGLIYDDWDGDVTFQSDMKVACKLEKDFWVMEAQIPFTDLGFTPHGAELMRMNLGRERQLNNEYSCLATGTGGFRDLSHFGVFRPLPQDAVNAPISILGFGTPGDSKVYLFNTSSTDAQSYVIKGETLDAARQKIRVFTTATKPDGTEIVCDYIVSGKTPTKAVRLSVYTAKDKTNALYTTTYAYPLSAEQKKLRVMKIAKPLCGELFSDKMPPQRDFHSYQWVIFDSGKAGGMRGFALQNALPYSVRDAARQHKANGMAIYANTKMIQWMKKEVFAEELGIPMAAMPRVLQKEIKSKLPYHLYILPDQRQAYLNDIRTSASEPGVRMVTFGDEISEHIDADLIEQFIKHPDDKDLLAFDAKIKAKYGQGKYGIPSSIEEKNPVALIAYRRALNDELVSLFREASQLARSINPNIVLVSDDPVDGQSRLYSFADQRGLFDIATHQLYPHGNPAQDDFGFLVRYIGDLTGAEVWPCPHVEEYAISFTPEEVLYALSSAIRNGATGFHYFLHDTTGDRSGVRYLVHERWGAPDRFAVELNTEKFLRKMPLLKFPQRDVALFSSTDSLRAVPGLLFRRHVDTNLILHNLLGYSAGASYRYINEQTMQNLEQYKFIVTAESKYLPRETFEALQNYVKNGGTLLVANPECFGFTSEGISLEKERQAFTGVTVGGASSEAQYFTYAGQKVAVSVLPCVKLTESDKAKVLARFANGDPALVENPFGKGRVISLATNPCVSRIVGNSDWNAFFHSFTKACNVRTDCDIWRFELPKSLLPKNVEVPGVCITNNAIRWEHFNPIKINSCDLTGGYSFSPNPDHSADCGKGEISFTEGKLTDRPRAVVAGSTLKDKSIWTDWAVSWKKPTPIAIHAKWSAPQAIKAVKFWVAGSWRDAKLEIGGKSFDFPLPENFNADELSVREFKMELPQAIKASELDVKLAQSTGTLIISEMEIWGE